MSLDAYAPSPVAPQELQTIAFLCGYDMGGDLVNLYNVVRKCVSLGPYGWGLALYAITLALNNGNIPYSLMPVPPAAVGRLKRFCIVDPKLLYLRKITDFEGVFTSTVTYTHPSENRVADAPDVFAACITYEDLEGRDNVRCLLIRRTDISAIPFIATIPSDTTVEKLNRICAERGRTCSVTADLTKEEFEEFFRLYGRVPQGRPPSGTAGEAEGGEEEEEFGEEELL